MFETLLPIIIGTNVLFFGMLFTGGVLWIRKLHRDLQAPEDLPMSRRVLDELEVVQLQLRALGERMERIEKGLLPGAEAAGPGLPPGAHDET